MESEARVGEQICTGMSEETWKSRQMVGWTLVYRQIDAR